MVARFRPRWTDLVPLALIGAIALAGFAVAPRLPAEAVIGWHVGLDGRVSRTYGPRVVGLVLLPAAATTLYASALIARPLVGLAPGTTEYRVFHLAIRLAVVALCAAQAFLLWVNL